MRAVQFIPSRAGQWVRWGGDDLLWLDDVAYFACIDRGGDTGLRAIPIPAFAVYADGEWPPEIPNYELITASSAAEAIGIARPGADHLPDCCDGELEEHSRGHSSTTALRHWNFQHADGCLVVAERRAAYANHG